MTGSRNDRPKTLHDHPNGCILIPKHWHFYWQCPLGNDLVISQQREVIERLQQNYYELQGEHHCLQDRLFGLQVWEETKADLEQVLLCLIKNKGDLKARVAIVNTCGEDLKGGLPAYLRECGVDVGIIGTVSTSFNPHNENLMVALREGGYIDPGTDAGEEWLKLVRYFASAVTGIKGGDFLAFLAAEGLITITGEPLSEVDIVLFLGNSTAERLQRIEELDYPLLEAWKEEGIRIIAAKGWIPGLHLNFIGQRAFPLLPT